MNFGRRYKKRIVISAVLIIFAVIIGVCAVYLGDYYRADSSACSSFLEEHGVEMKSLKGGTVVCGDENADIGFIFYPGGKVEHKAYIPLMAAIAERGFFCVLVDMPFNLAVFDIDAAEGIREEYGNLKEWYMVGHSLGGSMAASYISKRFESFSGLILLASYSTENLSDTNLRVLSVYGSEDGVMNRKKYEKNKSNLPDTFEEIIIEGGCHAYFGMYGEQKGDGTAAISPEEQIILTADAVENFVGK